MTELKIPDAVYDAVWAQIIGYNSDVVEALQVAAPLIVAAELRRLAIELSKSAQYEKTAGAHYGLHYAAYQLENRATELDLQGLTKE